MTFHAKSKPWPVHALSRTRALRIGTSTCTVQCKATSAAIPGAGLQRGNVDRFRAWRESRQRGQSGSKNSVAQASMIHGNIPIGDSSPVSAWNTAAQAKASARVRRQSSRPTIDRSKTAPSQLAAIAIVGCASQTPGTGMSLRAASQMRSGSARSNQSVFSFAKPANTYTTPTCNRNASSIQHGMLATQRAGRRSTSKRAQSPLALGRATMPSDTRGSSGSNTSRDREAPRS